MKKYPAPRYDYERTRIPENERTRQNHPIPNDLKIKRVYMKETADETCWAYMKLLRETSKMKKVYPVNPYVEVYQFRDNLYGLLEECPFGMADVWMYLTIGPEKALLVDTGCGIGNLKGLIDELTGGMEVIAVSTHFHQDHCYGNHHFDKVYCGVLDHPVIAKYDEHMFDFMFDESTGQPIWSEFDKNDITPFKEYELVACPDGTTFNLGGDHDVEVIHVGGNTLGQVAVLDKKDRHLFAGDNIISMRVVADKFIDFHDNIKRLAERIDEYDHVFSGHYVTDLESAVVMNLYNTLCDIAKDPEKGYFSLAGEFHGCSHFRYVDGLGTFGYKTPLD